MVNEHPLKVRAAAHITVAINRDRIVQVLLKSGCVPSGGTFQDARVSLLTSLLVDGTPLNLRGETLHQLKFNYLLIEARVKIQLLA